jgi:hypothetical protein
MKTIFVDVAGYILKTIDSTILLRKDDQVVLNGESWHVMFRPIVDLDSNVIKVFIWQNPLKDKG